MKSTVLSTDLLNKLFPFHFLVNADNQIIALGRSLAKLLQLNAPQLFYDQFYIERPRTIIDKADIKQLLNQAVIIRSINSDLLLRGQFELLNDNILLFVGAPWFKSIDDVVSHQLSFTDFAYHDPVIDLLHVMRSQEITNQEIRTLLEKNNEQKNALKREQRTLQEREYQLQQSEKRFASLIINLQTGILLEDENRKIVLCNTMFCDLFSIPALPGQMEGMDCSNAAEENKLMFRNPEIFVERICEILSERKLVLGEVLELADGRTYLRDYVPIFVSDEYKGHLWKYTDVTERHNFERKLRTQEEKYRGIIANMKLGLIEVNLADEIQFANDTFCELAGYSQEELVGKQAAKLFAAEKANSIIEEKAALRKRGVSDSYEIQVRSKTGQARWWFISGAPNYNDAGELIGSVGIHLDISDQKALEEELRVAKNKAEDSSRAKESFLANMSHEIRTPLNAIIGMVRELKRTDLTGQQKIYLHHADSASKHLLSIVNNILDMSKIEAGAFRINAMPFNIRKVLEDTRAIMEPAAAEKKLAFSVQVDDRVASALTGDAGHLRQVLINILGNAIKFTLQGRIDVRCSVACADEHAQRIRIDIVDTGIGMEPKFLENIFKKFSQEDDSTVRKFGGTGLGMAITNQLVQLMHGTIHVQSKKDFGSHFTLEFDWQIAESLPEEADDPIEGWDGQENLNVLIVEDNELNRVVARHCLNFYQCKTTEATNGAEAIALLKQNTYDVVLMDLHMPEMDGVQAAHIIRNELLLEVPIIALTANAFQAEIDKCYAAGMNGYVTKPFDEKELMVQIKKLSLQSGWTGATKQSDRIIQVPEKSYTLTQLEQLSHGDPLFLKNILTIFVDNVPPMLHQLHQGIQSRDASTIRSVAHQLKPTIDTMGIDSLYDVIRSLEKTSEVNTHTETLLEQLNHVLSEVLADIRTTTEAL